MASRARLPCAAERACIGHFILRFQSAPIITGNFESCFNQRDESTVNAAVFKHPRNMLLSTVSPAKWAFAAFSEGVLTVAMESGKQAVVRAKPRR
jgi:hypothetical protein